MASHQRRTWDERNYRTTWDDVENWVQALYEDFHLRVDIEITITTPADKVNSAVRVVVRKPDRTGPQGERWSDWKMLPLTQPGAAEHLVIQMLSRAWLDLDLVRVGAEAQATLL